MSTPHRPEILEHLRAWRPAPLAAGARERVLGVLGAALGLLLTAVLSRWSLGEAAPWLIAPMGASAVLLYAVPASPLAHPWAVLGGNVVSALVGVACVQWLGAGLVTAALAAALAIGLMFLLRCLHPPGGAVALTAVLGGPAIHALGYQFALWPVALNSFWLLLVALVLHNTLGRRYPHHAPSQAQTHRTSDPPPSARLGLSREDLEAALAGYGPLLDIDRADLEEIVIRASLHAQQRHWGDVRCADIMSRDVVTVAPRDSVDQAWELLAHHRVKALPVTDAQGRLAGILSMHDFFLGQSAVPPQRVPVMSTARYVEEIMTRRVRHARTQQRVVELVALFSDGGLHHLPVLDEQERVVGMLTQSDLLAALFRLGQSRL